MNDKEAIIEMIEQIESDHILFYIYGTVKAALMQQEAENSGTVQKEL